MWHALATVGEAYAGAMLALATVVGAAGYAKRRALATLAANRKKARGDA
jgi:hypothetical protein